MVRDIRFKGKSKKTKLIVEGSLLIAKATRDGVRTCWIKPTKILMLGSLSTPTENFIEVFEDSVCEFTDVYDILGKAIYENDTVLLNECITAKVVFREGVFGCITESVYANRSFEWNPLTYWETIKVIKERI